MSVREVISTFEPDTVVQFAEAPLLLNAGDYERRYTVDNNISGTHNICSVFDLNPTIHLVHLGTIGVYEYNKIYAFQKATWVFRSKKLAWTRVLSRESGKCISLNQVHGSIAISVL